MKKKMKLILTVVALITIITVCLTGCENQADIVSYNLSKEADNFNCVRQLTVINCLQGDVLFQMTGRISITADTVDNQLEIIVEESKGQYKKHFVGLSDNVTYVVEDITVSDVDEYNYTLNFNPKMWLPYKVETVD
jgi:uncharacterized lipoprotein NlpE involved in copper resistance